MTKRTKFAAALMIITAGSALIGANTAGAEEVKASRHHPGHMPPPPPHEWREPPHHGGPGGPGGPGRHMPPPDWDRRPGEPRRMGFQHYGPGGHVPPPPPDRGPGGHVPPPPPPEKGVPPRW